MKNLAHFKYCPNLFCNLCDIDKKYLQDFIELNELILCVIEINLMSRKIQPKESDDMEMSLEIKTYYASVIKTVWF